MLPQVFLLFMAACTLTFAGENESQLSTAGQGLIGIEWSVKGIDGSEQLMLTGSVTPADGRRGAERSGVRETV